MEMATKIALGVYQHYKGKTYQLIGEGTHTETDETCMIYQALYDDPVYGPNPIFIRPKSQFIQTVEWEGKVVPRFKKLS